MKMRVGHGYDVHRLVEGRRLILGGVEISWEKGLLGHSDADVLTHAVMDALLGAAGLGDIGTHFPDTDSAGRWGISTPPSWLNGLSWHPIFRRCGSGWPELWECPRSRSI